MKGDIKSNQKYVEKELYCYRIIRCSRFCATSELFKSNLTSQTLNSEADRCIGRG